MSTVFPLISPLPLLSPPPPISTHPLDPRGNTVFKEIVHYSVIIREIWKNQKGKIKKLKIVDEDGEENLPIYFISPCVRV